MGINSEVRYQILNDQSQRFGIDPISGQVRAVASFSREAGKVFGFDVKATDRKGADDGKSAIANVFVSRIFRLVDYGASPFSKQQTNDISTAIQLKSLKP